MTATLCDEVQQAVIDGVAMRPSLEAHRDACEECRFVAALSRNLGPSRARDPSESEAQVELAAGEPLAGRYSIEALIGRGGQGRVYRALDLETGEVIALKLVAAHGGDELAVETANARRARHPNICRVYHTERLGNLRLIIMEYIPGPTLGARMQELSRAEAIQVFAGICRGVCAAHEAGVLHLDLKPQNVLLRDGSEPIITDFGLSQRVERAIGGSGTPRYMAPEQRSTGAVDRRTDIYALGRILDDLMRGRSRRLRRVARRACAADPADRPSDVTLLLRAIEAPVGWRRWARRGAAVALVLAAALAIGPLAVPPPAGRRVAWRQDLWEPDPIAADVWNVALNSRGEGLPSVETPDELWGCARSMSDLLDGRARYETWEHGIAWRPPPNPRHPEYSCIRLRAASRCGVPQREDQLCEMMESGKYRLLDAHVSDLAAFPTARQGRLGFRTPVVPCGERSVTVHLDRPRRIIAVRAWYREFPTPRRFRIQLWDAAGQLHESATLWNVQGRSMKPVPEVWQTALSLPVTTVVSPVVSDRVRLVIDTCSTLEDDEFVAYLAGASDKVPALGWLYEIEVFARVSRYEAWRRTLFDD